MKTLAEIQNDYGFYEKETDTRFTLNGIYPEHQIVKDYPSLDSKEWKLIPNNEDVYIPFFIKIGDTKYICELLYKELYESYLEGNMYFTLDDILGIDIDTTKTYNYIVEKYKDKLKDAGIEEFKLHSNDGNRPTDIDILNQFLYLFGKNADRVHAKYKLKRLFDANDNPTADFPANVAASKAARDKIRSVDQYLVDTTSTSSTQTSQTYNVSTPQKPAQSQTTLQQLWGGFKSIFGG